MKGDIIRPDRRCEGGPTGGASGIFQKRGQSDIGQFSRRQIEASSNRQPQRRRRLRVARAPTHHQIERQ